MNKKVKNSLWIVVGIIILITVQTVPLWKETQNSDSITRPLSSTILILLLTFVGAFFMGFGCLNFADIKNWKKIPIGIVSFLMGLSIYTILSLLLSIILTTIVVRS